MTTPTAPSIEIFRAGTHVAASGLARDYTVADLRALAASYDPALHEAPLVIGHPQDHAPAYGWVQGLRLNGDTLTADLTQVDPAFADLVREGRYKKRSVSLYLPDSPGNPKPGGLYLRHVGFLGAQPPAVKGLRDAAFASDDSTITLEFSDEDRWAFSALAGVLRSLREWLISERDLETADRLIPEYAITAAADAAAATESPESPESTPSTYTDPPEQPPVSEETPDYPAQAAALAEREAALVQREAALAAAENVRLRQDAAAFAEAQVAAGRVLPRQKAGLIETLLAIGPTSVEFADGAETVKTGSADWLRQFIADLPTQVDYRERSAPTFGPAAAQPTDIAARAAAYHTKRQQANQPISYTEAVDAVLAGKDL